MTIDMEAAFRAHLERQNAPTTTVVATPPEPTTRPATETPRQGAALMAAVAKVTGVPVAAIKGPRGTAHVCRARQIFCWLARRHARMSYARIGLLVGKDHSTVQHGVTMVESRRQDYEPDVSICDRMAAEICRAPKSGDRQ